jgi:hypothetical protein
VPSNLIDTLFFLQTHFHYLEIKSSTTFLIDQNNFRPIRRDAVDVISITYPIENCIAFPDWQDAAIYRHLYNYHFLLHFLLSTILNF